jgi:hypothetical protein
MASLLAGPCATLTQGTCVFAGHGSGPCVPPPVLLALKTTLPSEAAILNLTYTPGGLNAV